MSDTRIEMPCGTGKTIGFWRTICLPSYPPQYRYECSKCSVCSKEMSNYCPYCGAEMQFLEREFYSEVQLDVEMKRKQCFADDMELEKISCKQCRYNTGRCDDCLLEHSKECPKYEESEEND